jgi:hypothetical protein
MFLAINARTLAISGTLEACALSCGYITVCLRMTLHAAQMLLPVHQPMCLRAAEFTRTHPIGDAVRLTMLAIVETRRAIPGPGR